MKYDEHAKDSAYYKRNQFTIGIISVAAILLIGYLIFHLIISGYFVKNKIDNLLSNNKIEEINDSIKLGNFDRTDYFQLEEFNFKNRYIVAAKINTGIITDQLFPAGHFIINQMEKSFAVCYVFIRNKSKDYSFESDKNKNILDLHSNNAAILKSDTAYTSNNIKRNISLITDNGKYYIICLLDGKTHLVNIHILVNNQNDNSKIERILGNLFEELNLTTASS